MNIRPILFSILGFVGFIIILIGIIIQISFSKSFIDSNRDIIGSFLLSLPIIILGISMLTISITKSFGLSNKPWGLLILALILMGQIFTGCFILFFNCKNYQELLVFFMLIIFCCLRVILNIKLKNKIE